MRGRHPNRRPIMLKDHNPYNKYGNVDAESASITSLESNISGEIFVSLITFID